jgi:GAF domain-containing protein
MERSVKATALLERLVIRHRSSAVIFRAHGRWAEARRSEMYAGRLRLSLDAPLRTQRMLDMARELHASPGPAVLYERALDGAVRLLGADFGNIQLSDPGSGSLRIAAQQGFGSEFLDYFAVVEPDELACGRAASRRAQTVVADVLLDPAFAAHRHIIGESGFRSVQSTPLVDPDGGVRGVVSTHFLLAQRPAAQDLLLIEWFAEHVGAAMAGPRTEALTIQGAIAGMHERVARSHDGSALRHERSANALTADGQDVEAAKKRERARSARERAVLERERAHAVMALRSFA